MINRSIDGEHIIFKYMEDNNYGDWSYNNDSDNSENEIDWDEAYEYMTQVDHGDIDDDTDDDNTRDSIFRKKLNQFAITCKQKFEIAGLKTSNFCLKMRIGLQKIGI
jgi:hypothetical protein